MCSLQDTVDKIGFLFLTAEIQVFFKAGNICFRWGKVKKVVLERNIFKYVSRETFQRNIFPGNILLGEQFLPSLR